jgi:hypothetical protein
MPEPTIEARVLHSPEPLGHIEPQESIRHLVLLHLSAIGSDKYLKIASFDEMTIK